MSFWYCVFCCLILCQVLGGIGLVRFLGCGHGSVAGSLKIMNVRSPKDMFNFKIFEKWLDRRVFSRLRVP